MSKKKKYKKRKREKPQRSLSDRHHQHLCYQRRHWNKGWLKILRNYYYCIVKVPRSPIHKNIHEFIGDVPQPKGKNAKDALEQLMLLSRAGAISDNDPIEKRLYVLAALFDCCDQPTADAFRKQLEIVHRFNKKAPP